MHFSFEKHVPSPVVKDFSVENLETTPSISLSKFRLKSIYLGFLIIGVVFLDYNGMKVQFGLCSVLIFLFLSSLLSFSIGIFLDRHEQFTGLQGRESQSLFFLVSTSTSSRTFI